MNDLIKGDMGKLYARQFRQHQSGQTITRINVCDLPSKYEALQQEFKGWDQGECPLHVCKDGFAVVRRSDFIIYSVEAAHIESVVAQYGPATKMGAIVAGQTSVKEPEIKAFEKYLPPDVHIVTCHSLHGPSVDPQGQPLVIIRHKSDDEHFNKAKRVLSCLGSNMVHLSYLEHDIITADTQASRFCRIFIIGRHTFGIFKWENPSYTGGIENVKILMALRMYGNKWHVYGGLAIFNPSALTQILQYAQSVSDLFKLMIQEKHDQFKKRVRDAANFVFGSQSREPILLNDHLLDTYSLSAIPREKRKPNSHISLLAMVDCWHQLQINPFDHLICQTPPFRLLLGITEYCFCNKDLLESSIQAALSDYDIRADDMEFFRSVQGWAEIIQLKNMDGYRQRFEETADFFGDRLFMANKKSSELIRMITQKL